MRAYAGIPVHFYEAPSHGDVLAGVQVAAEPWKGGRAAVDYAHVEDELSGFGDERDDFAAAQVWHAFGTDADLHGRFTWLDGPSDVSLRGTLNLPGPDLLVQGSIYRLLEAKEELTTELDPYTATLHGLEKYWLGELRATLGLGEKWRIETGGYVRELDDDVQESDYNRNTRRFWILPSVDDLVAGRSTLSAGLELWTGDGERIETWIADNMGPQAQLRSAVEDGLETARRLGHLVERAERTLEEVAEGGLRLHPASLEMLSGRRSKGRGALLPWTLCLILAGLVLGLLIR